MDNSDVIIANSDLTAEGEKFFGFLEKIENSCLEGWFVDKDNLDKLYPIELYINNFIVGKGIQNIDRPDIASILQKQNPYGFKLNWCESDINKDEIEINKKYDLLFKINGRQFQFDNCKEIDGKKVWQIINQLPKKKLTIAPREIKQKFEEIFEADEPQERENGEVKLIAYYLPQYHKIPENDEWWGYGFTEWTNVAQGRPLFKRHYQPHVPGELGFYDLGDPRVREAQARLAREYGIYGFCYYYYWFKGRRLLEKPLEEVLASGKPDFPFCICWANETWSRRWDGSENEILIKQEYGPETDENFIKDVLPLFKDKRYIKINGAPFLMIYRITELPDPKKTINAWRNFCKINGIPKIHICGAGTFGFNNPYEYGCDSMAEFPPHGNVANSIWQEIEDLPKDFEGGIYDYGEVVKNDITKEDPTEMVFPGVMTSWDNTVRRKKGWSIFLDSKPELFEVWLRAAIDKALRTLPKGARFVFINAWNEWAEGAHLEPDRKHGRAYLEAVRRALTGTSHWRDLLDYAQKLPELSGEVKEKFLKDIFEKLQRMDFHLSYYENLYGKYGLPKEYTKMRPGKPHILAKKDIKFSGMQTIEQINFTFNPARVDMPKLNKLFLVGWCFTPEQTLKPSTPTWMLLVDEESREPAYNAFVHMRQERKDLGEMFRNLGQETVNFAGLRQAFDLSDVNAGFYRISFLTCYPGGLARVDSDCVIEVIND